MIELCGCCSSGAPPVPARTENRPELSAVGFRLGTFGTFRAALLRAIAETPEMSGLRTRLSDDYTITLFELWAAVADILTFYQERAANEGFLRTARLRDSMLRMVRLLGYQVRPGAAATARLAFTLDPGTRLTIPVGLRVQSVPAAAEQAQKFETLEARGADARFNRLRMLPRPVPHNPLAHGSTTAYLAPSETAPAVAAALHPGDEILLWRADAIEELTLRQVEIEEDRVKLRWATAVEGNDWDLETGAYKAVQLFRLFGHGAPDTYMVPVPTGPPPQTITGWQSASTDHTFTEAQQPLLDGRYAVLVGTPVLAVVRTAAGKVVVTSTHVTAVDQVKATVGPLTDTVTRLSLEHAIDVPADTVLRSDVGIHVVSGAPIRFWPYALPDRITTSPVYVSGRRVGWQAVEIGRAIAGRIYQVGARIDTKELDTGRPVLLVDAAQAPVSALVAGSAPAGTGVTVGTTSLDVTTAGELGFGGDGAQMATVLVSRAVGTAPGPDVIVPHEMAVTIGVGKPRIVRWTGSMSYLYEIAPALQTALQEADSAPAFRQACIFVSRDQDPDLRLIVVPGVIGEPVSFAPTAFDGTTIKQLGLDAGSVRLVDGLVSAPLPLSPFPPISHAPPEVAVTIGFDGPRTAFLSPVPASIPWGIDDAATNLGDAIRSGVGMPRSFSNADVHVFAEDRLLVLPGIEPEVQDFLRIDLVTDDALSMDASTSVLLGNVAAASHGESVRNEIVGDADAARAFQRFALRKKPVTYVPAAVPGGLASTLVLRVNGVEWREAPTLHGTGPRDEIFVTRIADDGTLTLQFGDGTTGTRPPTGRGNIIAAYRQGLGLAGRVRASTLTTLLDRPAGLKAATNPAAAEGGADPETLEHARRTAPGTVRTFGRAVSLRDFEDVALASGEVAKASATWVWAGATRVIHLTVAAQQGGTFGPEGLRRIRATLQVERDPNHALMINNYVPVPILVALALRVGDRYATADVVAAARQALLDSLAFDALDFAQSVHLSDIFRVLQPVPGVVAVDVDELDFKTRDPAFRTAHGATSDRPQPHLRILPAHPSAPLSPQVLPAELATIEVPSQDLVVRASGGVRI